MAINEILFLKAVFPRPLHPHDFEGPEAEVPPTPGVGRRTNNSRDTCKQERFSTDLVHAKYPLKRRHTSKIVNEPVKKCGRYATQFYQHVPSLLSALRGDLSVPVLAVHAVLTDFVLGDSSR